MIPSINKFYKTLADLQGQKPVQQKPGNKNVSANGTRRNYRGAWKHLGDNKSFTLNICSLLYVSYPQLSCSVGTRKEEGRQGGREGGI